jgi:hypothetical protein
MAKKFKLIAGIHVDENGKSYKAGDVISSEHNLAPQPSDQGNVSDVTKRIVPPTSPNHSTAGDATAEDDESDDVTDDFSDAQENDFVVRKTGKKYFVYDKDDKSHSSPLEPDGSTSKADVSKVIKSALGDSKSKK